MDLIILLLFFNVIYDKIILVAYYTTAKHRLEKPLVRHVRSGRLG
jgi:hypothetical protein